MILIAIGNSNAIDRRIGPVKQYRFLLENSVEAIENMYCRIPEAIVICPGLVCASTVVLPVAILVSGPNRSRILFRKFVLGSLSIMDILNENMSIMSYFVQNS